MRGRPWLRTARDLAELTKPRVTVLVVVTELLGVVVAPARLPLATLCGVLLSTALAVGSANTLNCYLERDSDRQMERTRNRPLPARRLAPELAYCFGLALGAVALVWQLFSLGALTAGLTALAIVVYVAVYTPLKRVSPIALYAGAVPGALPPVIGYCAASGALELPAIALSALLFVWQVPHFLAIALLRKHEYARAGLRTLPVVHGDGAARVQIVAALALLLPTSLWLMQLGSAGRLYGASATLLGMAWLSAALFGDSRSRAERWARRMFVASLLYISLLVAALLVDRLA